MTDKTILIKELATRINKLLDIPIINEQNEQVSGAQEYKGIGNERYYYARGKYIQRYLRESQVHQPLLLLLYQHEQYFQQPRYEYQHYGGEKNVLYDAERPRDRPEHSPAPDDHRRIRVNEKRFHEERYGYARI